MNEVNERMQEQPVAVQCGIEGYESAQYPGTRVGCKGDSAQPDQSI